jgi:hypothetical protein
LLLRAQFANFNMGESLLGVPQLVALLGGALRAWRSSFLVGTYACAEAQRPCSQWLRMRGCCKAAFSDAKLCDSLKKGYDGTTRCREAPRSTLLHQAALWSALTVTKAAWFALRV